MLHLGRADAEGEGTKGTVCRRVGVATDDRHARLGGALLGSDDMHDALAPVVESIQGDAGAFRVAFERGDLGCRHGVGDALLARCRRHGMVDGRQGELGPADGSAAEGEGFEGLRRGDLVDEMEIDVEQIRLAGFAAHDVAVPDLVEECAGCIHETASFGFGERSESPKVREIRSRARHALRSCR